MNNGLNDVVVKVIIETAYLSDKMKRLATQIVAASGADFVKTSTGFALSAQRLRTWPCSGRSSRGPCSKGSGGISTSGTPSIYSTQGLRGSA